MTSETEAEIVFTASIEKGWHVYSTGLGDDGPISATFNINASNHVETMGKLQPVGKEISTLFFVAAVLTLWSMLQYLSAARADLLDQ